MATWGLFAALMLAPGSAESPTTDARLPHATVEAANQLASHVAATDWLGPLAPIALSPFFGITCLSGMAVYGDGTPFADNALIRAATPLKNPAVFWTFLTLTIITSLPRFTKVSKPFAQAVDQIESWAAIITILVVKLLTSQAAPDSSDTVVLNAGFMSMTADTLLMVAMVINIVVINAVRFFFEFLIWITPIPFLDAMFEVANKSACAALMAVYAFSPTLATAINILLFVLCLLAFRWIRRRIVFYRTMLIDPVLVRIVSSAGVPDRPQLTVFPRNGFDQFPEKAKCVLATVDGGWRLTSSRFLRAPIKRSLSSGEIQITIRPGLMTNSLDIHAGDETIRFAFSRRFSARLPELATQLNATLDGSAGQESVLGMLKAEFA